MNFSLGVGIFKSLSCLLFSGTPSVPQKEWLSPLYLLFLHVLSGLVRPFCFIHQENPTCLQSAKKFFKISGLIPNHPLPHLLQIYSCQSYNGISGKRESKRVSICHLDGSFSSLSMCSSLIAYTAECQGLCFPDQLAVTCMNLHQAIRGQNHSILHHFCVYLEKQLLKNFILEQN